MHDQPSQTDLAVCPRPEKAIPVDYRLRTEAGGEHLDESHAKNFSSAGRDAGGLSGDVRPHCMFEYKVDDQSWTTFERIFLLVLFANASDL